MDGRYRFADHARYLDAWFDAVLPDQPVVLVVLDWGSALGSWWAFRHRERVAAIAYMEAIVQPRNCEDFPADRRGLFQRLRSPEGERLVYEENFFVETVLTPRLAAFLMRPQLRRSLSGSSGVPMRDGKTRSFSCQSGQAFERSAVCRSLCAFNASTHSS